MASEINYRHQAVTAVSWTAVLRGSFRLSNLVKTAVLARLLLPSQFGVFGISVIALALLETLTETGINPFLIQEKDFRPYLNTAWIISILRGLFIAWLIYSFAPNISGFFNAPAALPLLRLCALVSFIRGFINPACVRLVKELDFRSEFWYRSSITLVEAVFTLALAFLTRSAASLVFGMLASAVWEVAASFVFISPRPALSYSSVLAKRIFSRGKWVTGFGVFEFLFSNLDNMVVGKLLGNTSLGLYQNAYKISTIPLTEINDIVYKTTFPLFSHMQAGSYTRYKSVAVKISLISGSLMFLMGTALFAFSPLVVQVLLGPNWSGAVPAVRVLAFLGAFKGLAYSFNSVFMAAKKPHLVTFITLAGFLGLACTIVPLTHSFGIVGAAFSALFGSLISLLVAACFIINENFVH